MIRCGLQDWDMFQTNLGVPSQVHAAARAISGGPVYISDRPGECNSVILSSVVLDDGKKRLKSLIPEMVLYIFMLPPPIYCCTTELLLNEMITYFMYIYAGSVPIPAGNALPISRTIFCDPQSDPKTLLTIWNKNPVNGHGVLGAFKIYGSSWDPIKQMYMAIPGNTDGSTAIKGSLFPCDCYSLVKELEQLEDENQKKQVVKVIRMKEEAAGGENNSWDDDDPRKMKDNNVFGDRQLFAMYFFKARKLTVQRLYEAENLAVLNFEVVAVSRVHSLQLTRSGGNHEKNILQWASIGLVNLFNAGGAIVEESFTFTAAKGGRIQQQFINVTLIGRGRFIAYCSKRPIHIYLDGAEVEWSWIENTPLMLQQYESNNNLEDTKDNNDPSRNNESIIPQQYHGGGDVVHHEVPMLEVNISQPYTGLPRRLQCEWD
eukprot:256850_1